MGATRHRRRKTAAPKRVLPALAEKPSASLGSVVRGVPATRYDTSQAAERGKSEVKSEVTRKVLAAAAVLTRPIRHLPALVPRAAGATFPKPRLFTNNVSGQA
jgi:hypothetical protein